MQTQLERDNAFGLSEALFNPMQQHLYVRGYAFFALGISSLGIEFGDRPPLPPRLSAMGRRDLLRTFPGIEPACGFEFFLPEINIDDLAGRVRVAAILRDGSTRRLSVRVGAEIQRIAADAVILSVSVDAENSTITVLGELLSGGCDFVFSSIDLESHIVYATEAVISPEIMRADTPDSVDRRAYSVKFKYRASAISINAESGLAEKSVNYKLPLEIRFIIPRRAYSIPVTTSINPEELYLPVKNNAPQVIVTTILYNRIRKEVFVAGSIANASDLTRPSVVWDVPGRAGLLPDVTSAALYQASTAEFSVSLPAPNEELPLKGKLVCQRVGGKSIITEFAVTPSTPSFDSDFQVEQVSLAWFGQHLHVQGVLLGAGEPELHGVTVDGFPLALDKADMTIPASKTRPRTRQRLDLILPLKQQVGESTFQLFAGPGSELKFVFRRPGSDCQYTSSFKLPSTATSRGLGQITGIRYAPDNQNLEVSGSFFGHFGAARVQLTINGERQRRSASVMPSDNQLEPIEAASDAPFSRWSWCDAVSMPVDGALLVEARVSDGVTTFAETSARYQIAKIPLVEGPLAPSYHVSPLRSSFDVLLSEARQTSLDPTIAFVFPGDMATAFGGGPTRLLAIGRYFRAMGFRSVLVDRSGGETPTVERTEALAESFDMRLGLPGQNLDEICNLCLDEASLGDTSVGISEALKQAAIQTKPDDQADLISRRTDYRFDAAAAFLMAVLKPDVVITHFAWTAGLLSLLPASMVRILDTIDIQYRRGEMHAAMFGDDSLRADRSNEIAAWAKADYLIAIQPEERLEIIETSGRNNVVLCGHGVTTNPVVRDAEPDHSVLFVGNRYGPNIDGITRFIREAWPRVHERVPTARLLIVGTVGDALTDTAPGVEILGLVDDLQAIYDQVAVVINPVDLGTGVSIKLIEALCNGRATVTTAVGIRGLAGAEAAVVVAEIPEMADVIIETLTSPAQRSQLEAAALRFADTELSPEVVFRELFNTIELKMYS